MRGGGANMNRGGGQGQRERGSGGDGIDRLNAVGSNKATRDFVHSDPIVRPLKGGDENHPTNQSGRVLGRWAEPNHPASEKANQQQKQKKTPKVFSALISALNVTSQLPVL